MTRARRKPPVPQAVQPPDAMARTLHLVLHMVVHVLQLLLDQRILLGEGCLDGSVHLWATSRHLRQHHVRLLAGDGVALAAQHAMCQPHQESATCNRQRSVGCYARSDHGNDVVVVGELASRRGDTQVQLAVPLALDGDFVALHAFLPVAIALRVEADGQHVFLRTDTSQTCQSPSTAAISVHRCTTHSTRHAR